MCVSASTRSYCEVLRKEDLDRAIRGRMTWQDDPQRRLSVFLCHHELHGDAVADGSGKLRSLLMKCSATSGYRYEKRYQNDSSGTSLEHRFPPRNRYPLSYP